MLRPEGEGVLQGVGNAGVERSGEAGGMRAEGHPSSDLAGIASPRLRWPLLVLLAGVAALVIPTLYADAQFAWATEQGAHGPIVLAIAVWLFARRWPMVRAHARPGSALLGGSVLAVMLLGYLVSRTVGSLVLESAAAYGALVATLYLFVGFSGMRQAWFPIIYFLFVLPPPGSVVATAPQPIRLQISSMAVSFLALFGLPVAQMGLNIYIDQYTLEVQAACGGLNSLISLSAIGLFYGYIRHAGRPAYLAVLFCAIVPMAVLANFVRVVVLVLITYFFGNDAAQGYLHQSAGLVMFAVAVFGTIAFDNLLERLWPERAVAA